ncbi:RGS domain-containing protein [Plasmodiophora brassicae]
MPASQGGIWFCFLFTIVTTLPMLAWYFWRRRRPPISPRMPLTTIGWFTAMTINVATLLAFSMGMVPCTVSYAVANVTGSITCIVATVRCGVLFWQCQIARAKSRAMTHEARANLSPHDAWVLDHQWVLTKRFFVPFWASALIAVGVYSWAAWQHLDPAACVLDGSFAPWQTAWFAIWIVLVACFAVRLRVCVDGFYIKREVMSLVAINAIMLPVLLPYFATVFLGGIRLQVLAYWLLLEMEAVICLAVPVILSYTTFRADPSDGRVRIRLSRFLQDADQAGLDVFREFLVREFAVENLHFLTAVQDFKKRFAPKRNRAWASPASAVTVVMTSSSEGQSTDDMDNAMLQEATEIYQVYIDEGARLQVNISGDLRDELLRRIAIASASPDMFNDAYDMICGLLDIDPFKRFLASDVARDILRTG